MRVTVKSFRAYSMQSSRPNSPTSKTSAEALLLSIVHGMPLLVVFPYDVPTIPTFDARMVKAELTR